MLCCYLWHDKPHSKYSLTAHQHPLLMTLHSQMIQLPNSYLLHLKSLSKISPSYKQKCTNMEDSWGGEVRSKIQQQGNKVVQVY